MIGPDDPRHGTYAGYIAHYKHGVLPVCDACRVEGRRHRKLLHLRGPQMVPLGKRAWTLLHSLPPNALADASGLRRSQVYKLRTFGPGRLVYRRTRRALLAAAPVTPVGIVRRLQALGFLGYSCADLARRADRVHLDTFKRLRRGDTGRCFVKVHVSAEIVRLYDELHMLPAPDSRWATVQRAEARRNGWVSALAWDDIDDQAETPHLDADPVDELDQVAVMRRMAGDRSIALTEPEQDELVVRCRADGWSYKRIETRTGVNAWRARQRLGEVA